MELRPYHPSDFDDLLALTQRTFAPFLEDAFPAMVGHDAVLAAHQHGNWRDDYREQLSHLHDPDADRYVLVATEDGLLAGFVAWHPASRPGQAEIELLAVDAEHRGHGIGGALLDQALAHISERGYGFVGLGTGGDPFHEPARRLYESRGFHPIPVVAYLRRL